MSVEKVVRQGRPNSGYPDTKDIRQKFKREHLDNQNALFAEISYDKTARRAVLLIQNQI